MSDDIRARFAAAKAEEQERGQRDAVSMFKSAVETQIKKVDQEIKKPGSQKTTTNNWFKPSNVGFRLHLGKTPHAIDGAKFWEVETLEQVKALFKDAIALATSDKEFRAEIISVRKKVADAAKQAEAEKKELEALAAAAAASKKRGPKAKPAE